MKYYIKHKSAKQLRIKLPLRRLTETETDVLYYSLSGLQDVISVSVFRRTAEAVIRFQKGADSKILSYLDELDLHDPEASVEIQFPQPQSSSFVQKSSSQVL